MKRQTLKGAKLLIKPGPAFNFVYMSGFVDLPRRIAVSLLLIWNQDQHHKNVSVINFPRSDTEAVPDAIRTASISARV